MVKERMIIELSYNINFVEWLHLIIFWRKLHLFLLDVGFDENGFTQWQMLKQPDNDFHCINYIKMFVAHLSLSQQKLKPLLHFYETLYFYDAICKKIF